MDKIKPLAGKNPTTCIAEFRPIRTLRPYLLQINNRRTGYFPPLRIDCRIELRNGGIGVEHRPECLLQRIEPGLEVAPVVYAISVYRLARLLGTRRPDSAVGFVEVDLVQNVLQLARADADYS